MISFYSIEYQADKNHPKRRLESYFSGEGEKNQRFAIWKSNILHQKSFSTSETLAVLADTMSLRVKKFQILRSFRFWVEKRMRYFSQASHLRLKACTALPKPVPKQKLQKRTSLVFGKYQDILFLTYCCCWYLEKDNKILHLLVSKLSKYNSSSW